MGGGWEGAVGVLFLVVLKNVPFVLYLHKRIEYFSLAYLHKCKIE